MDAATARIIVKCNYDGDKALEYLKKQCNRVLNALEDKESLYHIHEGWFAASGAATLPDLKDAIEAVMSIFSRKKEELQEECEQAIESADRLHALYAALKAAPPEE